MSSIQNFFSSVKYSSVFAICAVTLVTYLPSLKIQFYDGWWYLIWAGTMDLPRYLIQFFDPVNITQGYRPVQGLYIYLLYHLFRFNPDGYHIAQILLHATNASLLFLNVRRIGKNQRIAFVAGILYVVLPAFSMAVFWHAVADPLAAFFYLLTVLLWTEYLVSSRRVYWVCAFTTYIFALLSKEVSVFLPPVLHLIEWWFLKKRPSFQQARKYIPLLIAIIPYLWLLLQVQSHGEFITQFRFRIGLHMIGNLIPYLAVLVYPLSTDFPKLVFRYVWLVIVVIGYVLVMIRLKSLVLLFLAFFAVISVAPLTGFPLEYFETRYVYIPAISSAIVLALLFDSGLKQISNRWVGIFGAIILAFAVMAGGQQVSEASTELAETTRKIRVPFRDISQSHPSFPEDTLLYFVYSPFTAVRDFEGLFFLRYGTRVVVDGTNFGQPAIGRPANLRGHALTYVYYFDSTGKPIELSVARSVATRSIPSLPARFQAPIILEGYEVTSHEVHRGKALVVVLNWRGTSKIAKDYSVFVHLVDEGGVVVTSFDGAPGRGEFATSVWEPDRLVVDPVVLPISPEVPIGDRYRLEVGLYDHASGAPINLLGTDGKPIGTAVIIQPFVVVP